MIRSSAHVAPARADDVGARLERAVRRHRRWLAARRAACAPVTLVGLLPDRYKISSFREAAPMTDLRVLANDRGIRPAGPPDACFYCGRRVGAPHADDCVMVVRRVVYRVLHAGREVAVYATTAPAAWSNADCEFFYNDSSHCVDNDVDEDGFRWLCDEVPPGRGFYGDCRCGSLTFRVAERGADVFRNDAGR